VDGTRAADEKVRKEEAGATLMVRQVPTQEDFDKVLADAGERAVIVDFTATWCGPCQRIAPIYEQLAAEFSSSCVFIKVDVDENQETAAACGVQAMPTVRIRSRPS